MSATNSNISTENDHLILYKVSLRGDVPAFEELLQEDELILDRFVITSFNETPLHIAAMRGHLHLARALLSRKPKLADELDSFRRLPLHLASAEGYTDIVKELLKASPDACFARDEDGRIPLHLAAMKERVEIMKELLSVSLESIRERLDNGETILHSCVKYNRLEALKLLIETARDEELIHASDVNGNTILHLAAILKQVETTKYLLLETSMKTTTNTMNRNGFTALDALDHSPKDLQGLEIKIILLEAGVQRAFNPIDPPPPTESKSRPVIRMCKFWNRYIKHAGKRLEEAPGNILVAATVTASMAFQAGINPPSVVPPAPKGVSKGDAWQQNNQEFLYSPPPPDIPDASFLYSPPPPERDIFDPETYFWLFNTGSLMISLIIILLMISGVPIGNKFARFFLVTAMCISVVFISKAYVVAAYLQPVMKQDGNPAWIICLITSFSIPCLFWLIGALHCSTFLIILFRKIGKCILNQYK